MFFRRERPKAVTFSDRLETLRRSGFTVTPEGSAWRVARGAAVATVAEGRVDRAGILLAGETARLVDGGYQKFFRTPSGKQKPALASELETLHDFEEDLREALGLTSLYNQSLGTESTYYLYDRVKGRGDVLLK